MNWWKRNSNTVLTVVEIVGFVGTIVSTARAAVKISSKPEYYASKQNKKLVKVELAQGVYTEKFEDKTKTEQAVQFVKACFPEAITPLIFGSVTVASMIGTRHQYVSQQAGIASLYTMSKRMYDEHKDKVNELMNDICPLSEENPTALDNIEESMNGKPEDRNDIFFLEYSGRRFKSSLPDVEEALALFDDQFRKDGGCACFNDLYVYLGIAETKLGVANGFCDEKRMNNPYIPKEEWEHINWTIRKVTRATGINAEDSKKLEDNGNYIYMISFNNYFTDVQFYEDMCYWAECNGLNDSL